MKSKTLINKHKNQKTNPLLVETIQLAKKNEKWLEVAALVSSPRRKRAELNLDEISREAKDGETIVIPGKVLSQGNLDKKVKIVAFNFSESAREKLLKSKIDVKTIIEEIKQNPEAKGIKILTK